MQGVAFTFFFCCLPLISLSALCIKASLIVFGTAFCLCTHQEVSYWGCHILLHYTHPLLDLSAAKSIYITCTCDNVPMQYWCFSMKVFVLLA